MNVGMVFGIIFAIIVIGLLLVFGLQAILDFLRIGELAQIERGIDDLGNTAESIYYQAEGSSIVFDLNLPSGVKFCFVDPDIANRSRLVNDWNPDNVTITLIQENEYNVWFYYSVGEDGRKIKHLRPNDNFCFNGGKELYLENKGRYVSVEEG